MDIEESPLFVKHVKGWLLQDDDAPPLVAASRRTQECLRFPEISAIAQNGQHPVAVAKKPHIASCLWCSRAIAAARQVRDEDGLDAGMLEFGEDSAKWDSSFGDLAWSAAHAEADSLPDTQWSLALKTYLGAALQRLAVTAMDAPAAFDSSGALHIEITDCNVEGPVAVYLIADGLPIPVGKETVRNGKLTMDTKSIADFDLRNLRLPREVIELRPLSHAA